MDNLISVFMNYKVNRLVEYGVVLYQKDSSFIRNVLTSYFQTYIDNYYYGVFNTIDDENYNKRNLKLEFNGIMEEMLYEYQEAENDTDKEEYQENKKDIRELKELAYELTKIDTLEIHNKDEIPDIINDFVNSNSMLKEYPEKIIEKLIRLVKETYTNQNKLLQYDNKYFIAQERKFLGREHHFWYELVPDIKQLNMYRKGLVKKVNESEDFAFEKFECLVQKMSLMILNNFLENKETQKLFIELSDTLVGRGSIDERVLSLVDNPMFQKYVVLAVPYNTYLSHKSAFAIDVHFASIQDFRHINDLYGKVDSIYNEGFSHYLVVSDYRPEDRDFFINYKNDVMTVMLFEEE